MKRSVLVALAVCLSIPIDPPTACTTFCFVDEGQVIFGKNYDWNVDDGHLIVNKRGVSRSALDSGGSSSLAHWQSRNGSVTFNQYGRDFPSGGMNEKGLIVELMWLDGTVYPAPDSRPGLGVLEWIQYQMDMSATVADVIDSDKAIRIAGHSPLHYLVADRSGQVAVIEFLEGRMTTHTGARLPVAALTNNTYEDSIAFLARMRQAGRPAPEGVQSLHRFARTAQSVAGYHRMPEQQAVTQAFATLANAGNESTQWSIVYDAGALRLHFKTRRQPEIRTLELSQLDFRCDNPVLMLDMNAKGKGDVTRALTPWTVEANIALVRGSYARTTFLADAPESDIQHVGRAPLAESCVLPAGNGGAP